MIFQDEKGLRGFGRGSPLDIDVRNLKMILFLKRAYDVMSAQKLILNLTIIHIFSP